MSNVVQIAPASRVNEAWDEHCYFARQIAADPHRLTDRTFMENATRAEYRFKRLFIMMERGQ
jgi:hypothetical protein